MKVKPEYTEKRMPHRRCISCGSITGKENLIRVVKDSTGKYVQDLAGNMGGRGCYICRNSKCLERAGKRGVIIG